MNWGEFKKAVEEKGVTDEMTIWYIDISFPDESHESSRLQVCPQTDADDSIGLTIST